MHALAREKETKYGRAPSFSNCLYHVYWGKLKKAQGPHEDKCGSGWRPSVSLS